MKPLKAEAASVQVGPAGRTDRRRHPCAAIVLVWLVAACAPAQRPAASDALEPTTTTQFATSTTHGIVEAALVAMTGACSAVLTWQDDYLTTPLPSQLPDLTPVFEAHALLEARSGGYEPAEFLLEDVTVILDFYRPPVDVTEGEIAAAARASSRAMYHVELRCRYLADGVPELAGWIPDPALVPVGAPGAQAAIRACLGWVRYYTDVPDDPFERAFVRDLSLANAGEASAEDEAFGSLFDALASLYLEDFFSDRETGVQRFSEAFAAASRECQRVIQVPVRMHGTLP